MSNKIPPPSHSAKKPVHHRNGSDELDVFEAARYFSGATEVFSDTHNTISGESRNFGKAATQKHCMRPIGRMSLDMPNHRGNSIPLQAMLMDPMMTTSSKEKKSKQPSSPGGKLAHFLNSLFNQTSSKKSKSKSTKDEDVSPGGWRRKRRSSISHFRSGSSTTTTSTTTTATIMSDSKSPFSTSTSSGFRTPLPYNHIAVAHTPTKTTSYRDPRSYSDLKTPASQVTKIPINENLNKIENVNIKTGFSGRNTSFGNGFVEKVNFFDEKQDERRRHPRKYVSRENIKEFKRFIDHEDDGNDSDSSSDLFELTNCELGYYSSGLPVYETTHMDSIKRGAPISS